MHIPCKPYYVYICASHSRTLYVGMTNDLARRLHEHRTKATKGFTARYNVDRLVWWEVTGNVNAAIAREKQLKGYSRQKKIDLIEATNAGWNDLAAEMGLIVEEEPVVEAERRDGTRTLPRPSLVVTPSRFLGPADQGAGTGPTWPGLGMTPGRGCSRWHGRELDGKRWRVQASTGVTEQL